MGMIKEPLAVDFYVDPKPLTTKDQKMISDFILADKAKRNTGEKKVTPPFLQTGC